MKIVAIVRARGATSPRCALLSHSIRISVSLTLSHPMYGTRSIEKAIGQYVAGRYRRAIEVGIGENFTAALVVGMRGALRFATDVRDITPPPVIRFVQDDVFTPKVWLYKEADVIYAVRPGVEMISPLIALGVAVGADILVYHLGFEIWGDGGERIDCGVLLHRYHAA